MASKKNHRSMSSAKGRKADWDEWLKHWDTWSAIVGEIKLQKCGMYGCDEKVKVRGNKWKCVKCGAITTID